MLPPIHFLVANGLAKSGEGNIVVRGQCLLRRLFNVAERRKVCLNYLVLLIVTARQNTASAFQEQAKGKLL